MSKSTTHIAPTAVAKRKDLMDAVAKMDDFFYPKKEKTNPFENYVIKMEYVGSRVTCVPAPADTDEDILILATDQKNLARNLIMADYELDWSHKYPMEEFCSLRKGDVNLIITDKEEFFNSFMLATYVCKKLNVMDKIDRITVFQAILYKKQA